MQRATCVCTRTPALADGCLGRGLTQPLAPSSSHGQGRVGGSRGPRRLLSCLSQPWENNPAQLTEGLVSFAQMHSQASAPLGPWESEGCRAAGGILGGKLKLRDLKV